MAQAFAPEIGMDIGASNVTAKSGVSVDFSSVGRILGSVFEPPAAPSEGSLKRIALDEVGETFYTLRQVQSPVEKAVRGAEAIARFKSVYGEYSTEIDNMATSILGKTWEDYTPDSLLNKSTSAFLETDVGRFAQQSAVTEAMKDGGFDYKVYDSAIRKAETDYFAKRAAVDQMKTNKELRGAQFDQQFYGTPVVNDQTGVTEYKGGYLDVLEKDVSNIVAEVTTDQKIVNVFSNPSPQALAEVTTALASRREVAKREALNDALELGGDISQEELKAAVEAKLAPIDNIIAIVGQGQKITETISGYYKTHAEAIANMNNLQKQQINAGIIKLLIDSGVAPTDSTIDYLGQVLLSQTPPDKLLEISKSIPGMLKNPVMNGTVLLGVPSATSTVNPDGTVVETVTPGTEETKAELAKLTPVQLTDMVSMAGSFHQSANWKKATPDALPKLMNTSIGAMVKASEGAEPLSAGALIKFTGGTGMYEMAAAFASSPDGQARLLPNMDGFLTDQWRKNTSVLAILNQATTGGTSSYFLHSIENGKYTLKVNPEALRTSPELQKAVQKSGGSNDGWVVLETAYKEGFLNSMFGGKQVNLDKIRDSAKALEAINAGMSKLGNIRQGFTKTNNEITTSMQSLSTFTPPTAVEAGASLTRAEENIPANLKQYEPKMTEYFAIKDQIDAGNTSPQLQRRLEAIAKDLPSILTQPTENKVMQNYRTFVEAKRVAGEVSTRTETPTPAAPSMEMTGTTAAPAQPENPAITPRRIRWTDIVQGLQGGAGR